MPLPRNVVAKRARSTLRARPTEVKPTREVMTPDMIRLAQMAYEIEIPKVEQDEAVYEQFIENHTGFPFMKDGRTFTKDMFGTDARFNGEMLVRLASALTSGNEYRVPFHFMDEVSNELLHYQVALRETKTTLIQKMESEIRTLVKIQEINWLDGDVHKQLRVYNRTAANKYSFPTQDTPVKLFGHSKGHSAKFVQSPTSSYYYIYTESKLN